MVLNLDVIFLCEVVLMFEVVFISQVFPLCWVILFFLQLLMIYGSWCMIHFHFPLFFLAKMSSSRSNNVTKCVCVSVCSHFVCGAFKAFEAQCFEGVARVSQGCLFEVSRVFQGCFKEV